MALNLPYNRASNSSGHKNSGHRNSNGGNGHRNNNNNGGGGEGGGGSGSGSFYEFTSTTAKDQLLEILHVLFKHLRKLVLIFVVIAGAGLVWIFMQSPIYTATAKVIISTERADLQIQPTDLTSISTLKLNESVVNSEVHVIRSRELLENVIRSLDLRSAEGGVMGIANADDDREVIGERVIRLGGRLRVTPVRASNVIQIDFSDRSEQNAVTVVNKVLEEYLAYHAAVHGQKNLSRFYEEQSDLLEQNLHRAEEALRNFSTQQNVVAPAAELSAEVTTVTQMEAQLRDINATIAGAEEKSRVLRDQLAEQPSLVKRAQFLQVNPVVKTLSEHLIDRQVDRIALLRKYTEKDRHVRDNADEIAELQGQLDQTLRDEPTVVSQQVFRANPIYDARLQKLLDLEALLKEQKARKLRVEEDVAEARRHLIDLKQKALEFDRLDQEVQRRRATLELYEKREQEARIADAMDQSKLVNVKVIQTAAPPLPVAEQRTTSVLLALLSGLAVSIGGVFGYEYINRTLRFERDVERHLGLPVLGSISDASRA